MGLKYQPRIKDQKAAQRFHTNARRDLATKGPVKGSLFLTAKPKVNSPKSGTETPNGGR
ncbi:MAG TPA: hypothetical protein VFE25_12700 [Opitutaceae bacterium]|jgi:hypothetical protein|nr:hypothetical protein [Opitutaceae bacterium]